MRLRVTTYNIHRAIGVDRRFQPERIVEVLADHDADVLLLQEVDHGVPRSRRLDLAKELAEAIGYPHRAVGLNVHLRTGRYGNATLSRYPIVRESNIDLTVGIRKRRGCQHTTIEMPGGQHLDVFNLHLGLSARERRQQLGLLASSTEFTDVHHHQPCIVGGDFNDWRSLLRPFFVEVLDFTCATDRSTKAGSRAIKTYPCFSPQGGLDKIYYRGGMRLEDVRRSRRKLARVASDHLPIFAEFTLGQE